MPQRCLEGALEVPGKCLEGVSEAFDKQKHAILYSFSPIRHAILYSFFPKEPVRQFVRMSQRCLDGALEVLQKWHRGALKAL